MEVFSKAEYGRRKSDYNFNRPSGSSLKQLVKKFIDSGGDKRVLATNAGRKLGQSQLPQVADLLTSKFALTYWSVKGWKQVDGYAALREAVDEYNEAAENLDRKIKLPSKEAFRRRVHRFTTYETVLTNTAKSLPNDGCGKRNVG